MDYVTGFLINDNFRNVENILFDFVKSGTEKQDWIQNMELVRRYLNSQVRFRKRHMEKAEMPSA